MTRPPDGRVVTYARFVTYGGVWLRRGVWPMAAAGFAWLMGLLN